MRNHLTPDGGSDAVLIYALEALIRARATLDTVFNDDAKDLRDPSRKPFLRRQYQELGTAIDEIQRARSLR